MSCCCNSRANFSSFNSPFSSSFGSPFSSSFGSSFNSSFGRSFSSGIPSASGLFTVGNQTRFFSSDPCCELNAQRFLLQVDPCCKIRNNPSSFPIMTNNGLIFV